MVGFQSRYAFFLDVDGFSYLVSRYSPLEKKTPASFSQRPAKRCCLTDSVPGHFPKDTFFVELESFLNFLRQCDGGKRQNVLLVIYNRGSVRRWNGGRWVSKSFDNLIFGRSADMKFRHGVRIGQSCWTNDSRTGGKGQKNKKTKREKPAKKALGHEGLLSEL